MPGQDLGTVRRQGLAAWLKGLIMPSPVDPACAKLEPSPNTRTDPAPAVSELTRIIAGIVIALVVEPTHA
jgi:hypothetical protein